MRCTSSAATPAPRPRARRCTSSAPTSGRKARKRAAEQIRDVAAELLDLYARRKAQQGLKLPLNELEYQAFANAFPFEETEDQAEAIRQVLDDLQSDRPMDRIVCGDVGFGKTEVAMRAAFVAVQAGKQVAVLAPTTLLAQQHLTNFRDRFADWPVRIEALSRFGNAKETQATHRGASSAARSTSSSPRTGCCTRMRASRISGLLIVDEEHRFGVRDKERLQALRANVHVLTLTATPIPRTLNMALGGLRDLSLITTPPAERLAIKTFVIEWHGPTLREAVLRELRRGGQIYFVHNEIRTIDKIAAEVQAPRARGQRARSATARCASAISSSSWWISITAASTCCVCTTIIESGIDVPTANTIVINRADRMGLAQLHQLRGRVGRSHHRAYAYLDRAAAQGARGRCGQAARGHRVDGGARRRLRARDPRPGDPRRRRAARRAAERPDDRDRPGACISIMLEHAVKALKEGREPALDKPLAAATEVELRLPAFLPETYIARRARAAGSVQAHRRGRQRRGAR